MGLALHGVVEFLRSATALKFIGYRSALRIVQNRKFKIFKISEMLRNKGLFIREVSTENVLIDSPLSEPITWSENELSLIPQKHLVSAISVRASPTSHRARKMHPIIVGFVALGYLLVIWEKPHGVVREPGGIRFHRGILESHKIQNEQQISSDLPNWTHAFSFRRKVIFGCR